MSQEKCALCNKKLTEGFSSLMYTALNEEGEEQEFEYAKICNSCANVLDQNESKVPVELDDDDIEDEDDLK